MEPSRLQRKWYAQNETQLHVMVFAICIFRGLMNYMYSIKNWCGFYFHVKSIVPLTKGLRGSPPSPVYSVHSKKKKLQLKIRRYSHADIQINRQIWYMCRILSNKVGQCFNLEHENHLFFLFLFQCAFKYTFIYSVSLWPLTHMIYCRLEWNILRTHTHIIQLKPFGMWSTLPVTYKQFVYRTADTTNRQSVHICLNKLLINLNCSKNIWIFCIIAFASTKCVCQKPKDGKTNKSELSFVHNTKTIVIHCSRVTGRFSLLESKKIKEISDNKKLFIWTGTRTMDFDWYWDKNGNNINL